MTSNKGNPENTAKHTENIFFDLDMPGKVLYLTNLLKEQKLETLLKNHETATYDFSDLDSVNKIGLILYKSGRPKVALLHYLRGLRHNPDAFDIQKNLIIILNELNRPNYLASVFSWINRNAGQLSIILLSHSLKISNLNPRLYEIAKTCKIIDPSSTEEMANYFYVQILLNNYDTITNIISSGTNLDCCIRAVRVLIKDGFQEHVNNFYNIAVLPSQFYIDFSAVLIYNEDWIIAKNVLDLAKARYPDVAEIFSNSVIVEMRLLNETDLKETCIQYLKKFPRSVDIMFNVAGAYEGIKEYETSMELYKKLVVTYADSRAIKKLPFICSRTANFNETSKYLELARTQDLHLSIFESLHFDSSAESALSRVSDAWSNVKKIKPQKPYVDRKSPPKLAFLSGDLMPHAVTNHALPMISELNKINQCAIIGHTHRSKAIDTFCSSNNIQLLNFANETSDRIVDWVRSSNFDIIVDLSGRTENGKMRLHAERLAPCVISMLGFPGTMGHPNIDYIVADEILIPKSSRPHYSEQPLNIDGGFFPFGEIHHGSNSGQIKSLLKIPNKSLCLFSPHKAPKLNSDLISVWSKACANENVFLVMFADSNLTRQNIFNQFCKYGNPSQLRFFPKLKPLKYVELISEMDLMVDTYPFGGGATAIEAIARGLPILTLAGDSYHNRMAASMLTFSRCEELIATTIGGYETVLADLTTNQTKMLSHKKSLSMSSDSYAFSLGKYTKNFYEALLHV